MFSLQQCVDHKCTAVYQSLKYLLIENTFTVLTIYTELALFNLMTLILSEQNLSVSLHLDN